MTIRTLFQQDGNLQLGEVEVRLLPGIPMLHIVGLPDASLREYGIKLKGALKARGLSWPAGQQLVVSLRARGSRKGGKGAELAIALALMAITGQLSAHLKACLADHVVYGEVGLDGRVYAPADLACALNGRFPVLTGQVSTPVKEGEWWELKTLTDPQPARRFEQFDWSQYWERPDWPRVHLHEPAALLLALTLHMRLNVLLAGPQGSGKSTWAQLVHSMGAEPSLQRRQELASAIGEAALLEPWTPLQRPHHTITPQAMIGGGHPIQPGVITRAHGGVLIMDEFLQFPGTVIEALREPVESGFVEIARRGGSKKLPASFQLIGTTNLCPCGKLQPGQGRRRCSHSLLRCRAVCDRLSGPILDRFDVLGLTHDWLSSGPAMRLEEVFAMYKSMSEFALERGSDLPMVEEMDLGLSYRRRQSMARVARGLADHERSLRVLPRHRQLAFEWVVSPMRALRELFA